MRIDELSDAKLIGKIAKVGFHVPGDGPVVREWMWVRITAVEGDLLFGELGNEPQHIPNLRHGDAVCFRAEHVFGGEVHQLGTEGALDPVSRWALLRNDK